MNGKRDALFHNRIHDMTMLEHCHFDIMLLVSHIINCALVTGGRERASGKCLDMQFTTFIEQIAKAFDDTINTQSKCDNPLVFDDFIRIADFSYTAMKEIVAKPSTQIKKVETKTQANRATRFGSKTMQWMSHRPGRTIEEKISPENKVMTTKTVFSADTKENRHFMYLYKVLREAVIARMTETQCHQCASRETCEYEWIAKLKKMMAMNMKMKRGELSEVKALKQSYQNNKLMCDKNYKIIWDAVQMLSKLEDKIEHDYNTENLIHRLSTVLYWAMLGKINAQPGVMIKDYVGALQDKKGKLWFGLPSDDTNTLVFDINHFIIVTNDDRECISTYRLYLTGSVISLRDDQNERYAFDVKEHFKCIQEDVEGCYFASMNQTNDKGQTHHNLSRIGEDDEQKEGI